MTCPLLTTTQRQWLGLVAAAVLLPAASSTICAAPALKVDRFVLSGGGGRSEGGPFGVTGSIGQKEGEKTLVGGGFRVAPGLWSIIGLVQLSPGPTLGLRRTGSETFLFWPKTALEQGYYIEQTATLGASAAWQKTLGTTQLDGDEAHLMITIQPGNRFFRLKRP